MSVAVARHLQGGPAVKRLIASWKRWRLAFANSRWISLRWWQKQVPLWLSPQFFWSLLGLPFRWFFAAWQDRRLKHLVLGLPALALVLLLGWQVHLLRQQSLSLPFVYWEEAKLALEKKDYPQAQMLLERVLQENRTHIADARFGLALVFDASGDEERAERIFRSLAPDNARGHRESHQRIAMILAESISPESPSDKVQLLKWHLEQASNQDSPEMSLAWGRYALAIQDLLGAKRYLERAATNFPELWMTIGEVNAQLGNTDSARESFEKASTFLVEKLRQSAGAEIRRARTDYAHVLVRLGRLDEARDILEEALREDPEGDWKRLLANLYVSYHDLLGLQGGVSIGELLQPIAKSLEYDANFPPALNRLMGYVDARTEGNVELRRVLERVVAEGKEPALANLALGNLCWIEGDVDGAVFHFERSIAINSNLAVVMNNLAWLISHDPEKPDYERAIGLIDSALKQSPEDPNFLDTKGSILLLSGQPLKALESLEMALKFKDQMPSDADRADLHGRLAEAYGRLQKPQIAEEHVRIKNEILMTLQKANAGQPANK